MKTEIQESFADKSITFPCLMKDTGSPLVVFFSSRNSGVVVHPNEIHRLGEYEDEWYDADDLAEWQPFTGKIILSND